ncbi:unnamed protein product [Caenorhabditis sp. 36 PRJEB53466]|nr:unnamed protein product [Caenorhabditis sp. 36 PRJEB53466]
MVVIYQHPGKRLEKTVRNDGVVRRVPLILSIADLKTHPKIPKRVFKPKWKGEFIARYSNNEATVRTAAGRVYEVVRIGIRSNHGQPTVKIFFATEKPVSAKNKSQRSENNPNQTDTVAARVFIDLLEETDDDVTPTDNRVIKKGRDESWKSYIQRLQREINIRERQSRTLHRNRLEIRRYKQGLVTLENERRLTAEMKLCAAQGRSQYESRNQMMEKKKMNEMIQELQREVERLRKLN